MSKKLSYNLLNDFYKNQIIEEFILNKKMHSCNSEQFGKIVIKIKEKNIVIIKCEKNIEFLYNIIKENLIDFGMLASEEQYQRFYEIIVNTAPPNISLKKQFLNIFGRKIICVILPFETTAFYSLCGLKTILEYLKSGEETILSVLENGKSNTLIEIFDKHYNNGIIKFN